jgi:hypothetical protein
MHGHGLSLQKGDATTSEKRRGCLDSAACIADHLVELVKIAIRKYNLPLCIMGHSMGADGCVLATRRIVEECAAANIRLVCALYLALPMSATPVCFCGSAAVLKCCLGTCCGCPCCYCRKDFSKEFNPGLILGAPDRNAQGITLYNWLRDALLPPSAGGPPDWKSLAIALNVPEVNGRVFFGDKDNFYKKQFKTRLPPNIDIEIFPGVDHDFLSADLNSLECIGKLFAYIDEKLDIGTIPPAQMSMAGAAESN